MAHLSLNGRGCKCLVDTGASVSVISERVFYSTKCDQTCKLEPYDVKHILGIGDNKLPILGKAVVPIKIEGLILYCEFIVIPGSYSPEIIIGENFLIPQGAKVDYISGTLSLQNEMVTTKLYPTRTLNERVCLVRTTTDLFIAAKSECIVPVKVGNRKNVDLASGVIEPTSSLPTRYKVAGAKCAVSPERNTMCVFRLLNPYDKDTFIPRNSIVGTYTKINDYEPKLIHCSAFPSELDLTSSPSSSESYQNDPPRTHVCHLLD